MDAGQALEQLPALLGAGAGAAAKGAAGAAGKAVFERLRERLRRDHPGDADRLARLTDELMEIAASLGSIAATDEEIRRLMEDLAGSVQVTVAAGSQVVNYGHIDKSLTARDIGTVNM